MAAVLRFLGQMEITSLMIEGGAMVNCGCAFSRHRRQSFSLLRTQNSRRHSAVPFAGGAGFATINDAARVKSIRLHRFGEDFAVEGYLKDPYEIETVSATEAQSTQQ